MKIRSCRLARPGIAIILVLVLISVLSVMTWAMVTSASIRSQMSSNAADIIQAQYLAESGASLAAYYLQTEPATGVITNAATGDRYWGGSTNLWLWPDAIAPVDISVINPSRNNFVVISTARLKVGDNSVGPRVRLTVNRTMPSTAFNVLTGVMSNVVLPMSSFTINGGSTVGSNTVPAPSHLTLVQQLAQPVAGQPNLRAYNINGRTGFAQRITTSSISRNWPAATAGVSNPLNIWWTDVPLTIGNGSLNGGTLVVLNQARFTVNGNANFNATSQMPAVVATGDFHVAPGASVAANFNVNGVLYVGGQITGNSASSSVRANISGALLWNGSATSTVVTSANTFRGRINISYARAQADLGQAFSIASSSTTSVTPVVRVTNWEAN